MAPWPAPGGTADPGDASAPAAGAFHPFSLDGENVRFMEEMTRRAAGGNPSGLDKRYAHKVSLVYNPTNDTFYLFYDAVPGKKGSITEGRGIGLITSKAVAATLKTVADCQKYARECHQAGDDALSSLTDEDLARQLEAPYGVFPVWQYFAFAYDEHWHHRGQLYTYARLLGKEPPMLYDYENSPA